MFDSRMVEFMNIVFHGRTSMRREYRILELITQFQGISSHDGHTRLFQMFRC